MEGMNRAAAMTSSSHEASILIIPYGDEVIKEPSYMMKMAIVSIDAAVEWLEPYPAPFYHSIPQIDVDCGPRLMVTVISRTRQVR